MDNLLLKGMLEVNKNASATRGGVTTGIQALGNAQNEPALIGRGELRFKDGDVISVPELPDPKAGTDPKKVKPSDDQWISRKLSDSITARPITSVLCAGVNGNMPIGRELFVTQLVKNVYNVETKEYESTQGDAANAVRACIGKTMWDTWAAIAGKKLRFTALKKIRTVYRSYDNSQPDREGDATIWQIDFA